MVVYIDAILERHFSDLVTPLIRTVIICSTMERLEEDLRFFRQELARERDPFHRNLLLGQIRDVEQEIYNRLHRERMELERQNQNLQDALNLAKMMKK